MPDRFRVTITPRAADDLSAICAFIERDSPQNASAVAEKLLSAIDSLDLLPNRYKVHGSRHDPARAVHAMPVPPFIIYYRVVESRRSVQILTILHGHRRQPRHFQ